MNAFCRVPQEGQVLKVKWDCLVYQELKDSWVNLEQKDPKEARDLKGKLDLMDLKELMANVYVHVHYPIIIIIIIIY